MVKYTDSIDKIISVYLGAVSKKSFSYKGRIYRPKDLLVSPLIFRKFVCPPLCAGCCLKFSLDYLPSEKSDSLSLSRRSVILNDSSFEIWSDFQNENMDRYCKYVDKNTGRCKIHENRPFSCDFEPVRFIFREKSPSNILLQKLFGRGHLLLRVDGGRGALCKEEPKVSVEDIEDVVRKLLRLQIWADYFGVETCIDEIVSWLRSSMERLELSPERISGLYLNLSERRFL